MPIKLGLDDWKDPLGLYQGTVGLGGGQPVQRPADQPLPAGMRNNNPGNLKYSKNVPWEGLVGPSENLDQGDPQAVFNSAEKGMRAAVKLARNKYEAGARTANDLIAGEGGWTPGNRQAAANIAKMIGVGPDDDLRLDDPQAASKFMRALVTQEHGKASSTYSDAMISGIVTNTFAEMAQPKVSPAVAAIDAAMGGVSRETDRERGNPAAKGLARLAPPDPAPATGKGGQLHFNHEGQDAIDGSFRGLLEATSSALGRPLTITSGYRSAKHPVEARKKSGPGEHSRGTAADIDMSGMSQAERFQLVQDLKARGARRFGLYSGSPNMLHVDLKDQTGTGQPWFMYDRTTKNMGKAPAWFQAIAENKTPVAAEAPPAEKRGGVIKVGADFQIRDTLGIYQGKNPFPQPTPAPAPESVKEAPPAANPLDQIFADAEAREPGRYKVINERGYENWRKEWEAAQPSQFMKGLKGALVDLNPSLLGNTLDALGVLTDNATFREWGATISDWGKNNSFKRLPKVGSVADVRTDSVGNFISDVTDYAAFSLGSGLGSMAPGLAVGGATAAMTANPYVGFIAGSAGPSYVQNLGDVYGALRDDPNIQKRVAAGELTEKQLAGWAAAAAVPMAALDSASLGKVVDAAGGGIKRSIASRIVKGLATGALSEGTTEGLQEVVSQGVQEALGADKALSDQVLAVVDNAIGGALAGGAVGGAAGAAGRHGAGDVAAPVAEPLAQPNATDAPVPQPQPQPRGGPLARSLEHGERKAREKVQRFRVQDPSVGDMGAGELDGQTVTAAPDQSGAPAGMRRVIAPDGSERIMGEAILVPETAPAQQTAPASSGAPGRPPINSSVRVEAEGVPPFMARVEGYEGDEIVVFDSGSGEVYQVPVSAVTPLPTGAVAPPSPEPRPVVEPGDVAPPADVEEVPATPPVAADVRTEMPPRSEQKPALERFPGPPAPGQRVIVDVPGVDRFPGRVETYEDGDTEVMVKKDDGSSVQVPISDLYVSKLTRKEAEALDLRRDPPVEREPAEKTPTSRDVRGKTVVLPDDLHARIFDLGKERLASRKLLGRSALEADAVMPAEQAKIARELSITPEAAGQLADDYRYRVERAGLEARSQLPVKMHPISEPRLKQWQAESRAQGRVDVPGTPENDAATWWDAELTPAGRREVLAIAGVRRSEKMLWRNMPASIQKKLAVFRPVDDAPATDLAAHAAATSPTNDLPEPTQAQKEAGNYQKGHVRLGGLDISIENPQGSKRSGVDRGGKPWSVEMKSHYGYIKGTVGRDKDHIDIFIKPGTAELTYDAPIYVVDQVDPETGRLDEHKVMAGFGSADEARGAYLENYAKGWKGLGDLNETTLGELKPWLRAGDTSKPFARRYDAVLTSMATRVSPKEFVASLSAQSEEAAVVDPRGRLWVLKPTTNPSGDHAEFFARLDAEGLMKPDGSSGFVKITAYGNQIGASADGPVTDAQTATLMALKLALERDGGVFRSAGFGDNAPTDADPNEERFRAIDEGFAQNRAVLGNFKKGDKVEFTHKGFYREPVDGSRDRIFTGTVAKISDKQQGIVEVTLDGGGQVFVPARELRHRKDAPEGAKDEQSTAVALPKTVRVGIRNFPFTTYSDASEAYRTAIEATGATGSGATGPAAPPATIVDGSGNVVAYIAYNGNVFEGSPAEWTSNTKALYRPAAPERPAIKRALGIGKAAAAPIEKATGPTVAEKVDDLFASNKLFTADRVEAARARLKAKMGQINSGIDPEVLIDGMTIAGAYIEAGVRNFADYAKRMTGDFGPAIRPYLLAFWEGARHYPGLDTAGMTDAAESARLHATLTDGADGATISAEERTDEPAELDRPRPGSLEGAPAAEVPAAPKRRNAGSGAARGGEPDLFAGGEPRGAGTEPAGRLGDGAERVPAAAARAEPGRGVDADAVADGGDRGGAPARGDGAHRPVVSDPGTAERVESAATPAQDRADGYTITDADALGEGGAKTKFRNNVAAIRVLRELDTSIEGHPNARQAVTRQHQAILAKWVGWGGLSHAFYREDGSVAKGWEKEAAELKELLDAEEYRAALSSTRNAHYTSPEVVGAIWKAVNRLGFRGGLMLEPSVGAGNFIGLMPADKRQGTRITGVELDRITGGVAKNLYPEANIQAPVGFQNLSVPDAYFDLAIGNPPFGSERLYDPDRRHLNKFSIHNFFFAKAIDTLRSDGVLAMVVTNYFLDSTDTKARAYIAERADLLGAIRLPNNAFLKNAGTEVTTDIILLRKRAEGETGGDRAWVETKPFRDEEGREMPLNRYFHANPSMMLGKFGAYGTMYRGESAALVAREGDDLPALLDEAISRLPRDVMAPPAAFVTETVTVPENAATALVGSAFLAPDGAIWVRKPDLVGEPQAERVTLPNEKAAERVAGMVGIRDAFARLRRAQIDERSTDTAIAALRTALNTAYDTFVKANGPINADANKRLFRDDPTWPQVAALENDFDKGLTPAMARKTGEKARQPSAKKSAIFTERTQQPYRRPTAAKSAKDALAAVLSDLGRVDLPAMSRLYGKSEETIVSELGALLYKTPDGHYETADAYLSGNVKAKLAAAKAAAIGDSAFRRNVAALEDVIPADIEAVDIDVKPGAPWLPPKHVAAFVDHLTDRRGARAVYSRANAKWSIDAKGASEAADAQWATDRTTVAAVVSAAINGQTITIYDRHGDKSEVNQEATQAANDKVERVKDEWRRWIWTDDARREELARLYNDVFNTDVVRTFDGAHLQLPGKVSDDIVELRPHQKSFVWRALQTSTALADHVVGAGKTFAAIAAVMEKRRVGQWRKPLMVVPNHLVGQWAADFVKLYPGAKILAATKRDFEAEARKKFFVRMATGDWDAIIVSHSSFGRIGVDPEFEAAFIREQMDDLEDSMAKLRQESGKDSRNAKQLAKWRENLEAKLKKLLDAGRKDDGLTFNEIGIDGLIVDEAHEFKNLSFATSLTRVAGLGNPQGSQKAADLYMKVRAVKERTGGKNVMFLTGTPISNTMAEMFTMQRYLDEDALRAMNISHFDAWAKVFGEVVSDWELSPSGQYKLNSRFAKFVNMPELMQRYLSFADVITNDDIRAQLAAQGKTLPIPRVKGGKPQIVVVERSEQQAQFIGVGKPGPNGDDVYPEGSLIWRAEHLPKKAEKGADNMLKVMSDARKAALDMRLIDPANGDYRGSKIHNAADRMKSLYDRWASKSGAQLVFIDLSTPKASKAKEAAAIRDLIQRAEAGDDAAQEALDKLSPDDFMALDGDFSVYDDLRQKLIDRGVPAEQIAFIHDAGTDLQKEELFGKVRSGRVRFLFGSTAKMGAGTNVQARLVALHHLDAPWRPSDLEQREGRIIRQGNELYKEDPEGFEVEILRYATKNTLDARMWQTIEGKARFISQVRKGVTKDRVIEDIAGEAANAAEMKAAASGNPLILEEMDLRQKVKRLENRYREHEREQHSLVYRFRRLAEERDRLAERAPLAAADAARAEESAAVKFAEINGERPEKPKEIGAAILAVAKRMLAQKAEEGPVGSWGAFKLSLTHRFDEQFRLNVRGDLDHDVDLNAEEADATGLALRVRNTIVRMMDEPAAIEERLREIEKQIPALERQKQPFTAADELAAMRARHAEVLNKLKPAPKPAAAPAGAQPSLASGAPTIDAASIEEIGRIIREVSGLPEMRIERKIVLPEGADGWGAEGKTYAEGFYDPAQDAITLSLDDGFKPRTAYHEAFHRLQRLFLTDAERAVLKAEKGRLRRIVASDLGRRDQVAAMSDKEIEAEAFAIWATKRDSLAIKPHRAIRTAWERLAELIRRVKNFLANRARAGEDFVTSEDVFRRAKSGQMAGGTVQRADTPAFRRWFGDSKVVDEGGRPLVLYHGTDAPFTVFDRTSDIGFHFGSPDTARTRLEHTGAADSGRLIPVYLRIRNPLRTDDLWLWEPKEVLRELRGQGIITRNEATQADLVDREWVRDKLAAKGYDGIVYKNVAEGDGSDSYIVFDPTQIKSATTNRGSFDPANPDIEYSLTHNRVTEELSGRLTDLQPKLLKAIPLNYFTELARPTMTAVGDYLRVKRLLDAYRGKKHAAADAIAQDWLKYTRLGFGKDGKAKAAELADLMHEATLAGVDPSKTDAETRKKTGYDALRSRYMAMAPAGRELFARVRDAYRAQSDELDRILLDNVRKAHEIAQRQAENEYRKELERIAASNRSKDAKADARAEAERAYKAQVTKAGWSMKARLTRMRMAFESSRVEDPYFPLARFGRYFVVVRDVDGEVLSFSRRERAADRDRLAADLRKAYPTATVEVGVSDNATEMRQAMDPRIVAELESIIGGAGLDPSTMSTVLDQIWQRYLQTMPDLSVRKRFIHRKGTAGFSSDALRAFSSHMFHAAHQMGRLKYGLELQELTNIAAEQARDSDDPTRGVTLSNELKNRHKWVMNPTGGSVAQTMTSAAFVWYLGMTPAAAVVNMTQTTVLGIPILAARFGGLAKAAAAIAKASADTVRGKGSVLDAKLSADEKAAIEAFYDTGLIDRTQSHDLAGVGETGVDYSPLKAKAMAVISWMFHRAEVWNREVTALAAYRLARGAGLDHTAAVDSAHELTWKTHFDYSNSSRPALLQNDFAKVALVFRAHNINMLYRLFRDIRQSFKGETAAQRREARYQLAGIMGMMAVHAGVRGVPFFSIAMILAGALLGDDDDPMEFEQTFKKNMLEILGPQLGGVVLNGVPGHYLGIDLTQRIGMPDLWFRSPPRDLQGRDEFEYYVMNSLGATVSMAGDLFNGATSIMDGDVVRGAEAMVPKWARDLSKAWRYLNEGVTSWDGDLILDPSAIDGWSLVAQAIGFTPAAVAETYDRNSALKNAETRLRRRRQDLMNRFALAVRFDDDDARAEALAAIKAFNAVPANRPIAITPENLRQSLRTRERNAKKREDGVLIQNARLGRDLRQRLAEPLYRSTEDAQP